MRLCQLFLQLVHSLFQLLHLQGRTQVGHGRNSMSLHQSFNADIRSGLQSSSYEPQPEVA